MLDGENKGPTGHLALERMLHAYYSRSEEQIKIESLEAWCLNKRGHLAVPDGHAHLAEVQDQWSLLYLDG
jgi:hypothetical protein